MKVKASPTYNKRTSQNVSKSTITQVNSKLYLYPIIFVAAILPFIMHLYEYDTRLSNFNWFSDNAIKTDVFLFYKQAFFIIICSLMILLLFYKLYKDRLLIKFTPILLPILLYGLFALLSTIFSKYPSFGITGIYEQFESIFVILGYCFIIFYTFIFIKTENDIKFIFKFLLIGLVLMGLLGVSQILGQDFIGSKIAESLIIPNKQQGLIGLDFNFGPRRVYLTLYNPNYVGVYVSLMAPILVGHLITEKDYKKKIFYIVILIGLIISMIGSESKTSLISIFISILFILLFFRKYIFIKSKIMIAVICLSSAVFILFIALNFNLITNTVKSLTHITKSSPALTNINTGDDLAINYKDNELIISTLVDNNSISLLMKDSSQNLIDYTTDNQTGSFIINDERFSGIQVTPLIYKDILCIDVKIDGKDWYFTNQTGDNTYYYINSVGKFDKIVSAESSLFSNYDTFASGRGYIWSRTIPLLKDNILLGSGADTFTLVFPQQDYVGMYNAGFDGQLITRPHNMYLQIGVQSGVLSLIALLVFYGMYFISSIKLYIKGIYQNYFYQAGVSIFIGTVAYMIAGITNDSTIAVAPIFWVLIGIGIAINHKLKISNNQVKS